MLTVRKTFWIIEMNWRRDYEDDPVLNVKHSATNSKEFICKKNQDGAQNSSNSLMHKFPM